MELYIVKVGDKIFDYEWVGNKLSILELNKNGKLSAFPKLNNDDYSMIKNSGGTVLYRENDIIHWLVNINHILDEKVGVILGKELTDIVNGIINSIKRDIKLCRLIER
jgi:hypothetical protein